MSIYEMNAHEKEMMQKKKKKNLTGIKVLQNQKKPRIL